MMFSGGVGAEVVLEWGEDVPQDRHTPCLSQEPLPATATQISHICVVVRETKQPVHRRNVDSGHGYVATQTSHAYLTQCLITGFGILTD